MKHKDNNKIILFLNWWLKGINYFLPSNARSFLANTPEQAIIESDSDQFIFRLNDNICGNLSVNSVGVRCINTQGGQGCSNVPTEAAAVNDCW